jgi:GNAT superfamily N-acetyltransferase
MTNYIVRRGTPEDFGAIIKMINQLADFEKAPEKVTNSEALMHDQVKYFESFVAVKDEQIVGMAVYFFAYFTWVGKSLYLDDLFVEPEFRGQGIAKALISKIFEVAKAEHCARVRWQVLDWNKPAIALYKSIGAELDGAWINCDFDKSFIEK